MLEKTTRTYKFRLYPNMWQEKILQNNLAVCRLVYNRFVQFAQKKFVTQIELQNLLIELKEQEPWLKKYHSKMLQMIALQIHSAEKALTQLRKNGHNTKWLKPVKYNEFRMFCYNQSGFKIERHGNENLLWLSKIGCIQIRLHRSVIGQIKQIQVIKTPTRKWFACISCDLYSFNPEIDLSKITTYSHVGIDMGIKNFAYLSDGDNIKNPLHYVKYLHRVKHVQKKLSRRHKNTTHQSNNYKKALRYYQKIHERIANKRKNFHHQLSTKIAKRYPIIFVEDLKIQNMVGTRFAQRILDSGWGRFFCKLEYKAGLLIRVPPHNTSLICSRCNNLVPKTLAMRIHICNKCGLRIDRDHNASKNIDNIGFDKLINLEKIPKKSRKNIRPWQKPKLNLDQKSESEKVLQELQEPTLFFVNVCVDQKLINEAERFHQLTSSGSSLYLEVT